MCHDDTLLAYNNEKGWCAMALPIAPTPVITGKSAVAMARYMRESETHKDEATMPLFDEKKYAIAHKKMMERRAKWKCSQGTK